MNRISILLCILCCLAPQPALPGPIATTPTNGITQIQAQVITKAQSPKVAAQMKSLAVTQQPPPAQVYTNIIPIGWASCPSVFIIERTTNLASGVWKHVGMFTYNNNLTQWIDSNAPAVAFYTIVDGSTLTN